MIECLTVMSDICKKSLISIALAAVLLCFPVAAEEQAADANMVDDPVVITEEQMAEEESTVAGQLTERQKNLLETLGAEYQEGETFEEIMDRVQQQRMEANQGTDEQPTPTLTPYDDRMTPEMIQARDEAARKSREEYEARKAAIMERSKSTPVAPPMPRVVSPQVPAPGEPEKPVTQIPVDAAPISADSSDVPAHRGITDANRELELTITLPEKVEITALIELVGKQLGLNYIYDSAEVKGDVMLKVHSGRIKVKDTYALLESVLRFRGLVMTRRGNLVTIVPAARATEIDPMLIERGEEARPGDVIVTSIFLLNNISTDVAQNLLTSMNLSSNIVSLPETKSIIVTGYAYRMERIERMLAIVDVPGEKREFAFRRLEYTIASSVVGKIQALAENLGTVSVTIASTTSGQLPARPAPTAIRRDAQGRIIPQPAQPQQPGQPAAATTDVISSDSAKYGIYLDVDDRTNRILMVGTSKDIEEVTKLIELFDVPKQDVREIKQYKMDHADAAEIINTLSELGIIQNTSSQGYGGASYSRNQMTAQQRQPGAQPVPGGIQQTTGSDDFSGIDDAPQVVLVASSNSLLVNATQEQHEKIVSIIAFIDHQPEEDQSPVKVYPLENQSVEDIQDTLTDVVEKVAKEKAAIEQGAGGAAGDTTGKIQKTSIGKNIPDVVITGDLGTNSIVVFASRKDQEWIAELIKNLDKKRPQVLIDVTLVEITENDRFEYDLKYAIAKSLGSTSGIAGAPMPGAALGNQLDGSFSGSTTQGFYSDNSIQALLTLVEEKKYGRVMAKPKLLVNDNQEGIIKTTNKTYKPTEKTDYVGSDNPTAVVTTTWESYEAGVDMTIKPHISEGELLRLEISINRTDFDRASVTAAEEAAGKPYDTITSEVKTIVTVPDKSTIILGGLISINQAKGGGKVPILGDLPIIGGLFRSINNSSTQSKLYLFVKANILRPDDVNPGLPQLEEESLIHKDAFEESEREFQKVRDWPGLDKKPVKPEKVLEMK